MASDFKAVSEHLMQKPNHSPKMPLWSKAICQIKPKYNSKSPACLNQSKTSVCWPSPPFWGPSRCWLVETGRVKCARAFKLRFRTPDRRTDKRLSAFVGATTDPTHLFRTKFELGFMVPNLSKESGSLAWFCITISIYVLMFRFFVKVWQDFIWAKMGSTFYECTFLYILHK